jgi:hypothetical protein
MRGSHALRVLTKQSPDYEVQLRSRYLKETGLAIMQIFACVVSELGMLRGKASDA